MRKIISKWITLVFSVLMVCSHATGQTFIAPKQYLNRVIVSREIYNRDRGLIVARLRTMMNHHADFFASTEYFEYTQIIIDTVIYNQDLSKMVVFVMTRNPIERQLVPAAGHKVYYNATCYLGIRQKEAVYLSHIGPNFTNSVDKKQLKDMMRNTYFSTYARVRDHEGKYMYNIGDTRFWSCPVWDKFRRKM